MKWENRYTCLEFRGGRYWVYNAEAHQHINTIKVQDLRKNIGEKRQRIVEPVWDKGKIPHAWKLELWFLVKWISSFPNINFIFSFTRLLTNWLFMKSGLTLFKTKLPHLLLRKNSSDLKMNYVWREYYVCNLVSNLLVKNRKLPQITLTKNISGNSVNYSDLSRAWASSSCLHLCWKQQDGKEIENNRIKALISLSLGRPLRGHLQTLFTGHWQIVANKHPQCKGGWSWVFIRSAHGSR